MKTRSLVLIAGLLLISAVMFAQVNTASLTGLVTDPSGAVLADAKVTATNTAKNVETTTTTTSAGYYNFPTLPIGDYKVSVEKPGFRKTVSDVRLEVGQRARLDFSVQVGSATESVTVTASTPLLSTQQAATGSVIENKLVADLPLSARNWDDLLGLVAGVQADKYTEEGGSTAAGRTGGVNVHGVRSLQNNFVLDGVDNNSISENVQELSTQVSRPSVDAIQEFAITTNPYSAENGRSPGGLINVTTKSGSNAFHGSAYEYLRNDVFDAHNFFLKRNRAAKPSNRQNQFGGSIGGPVIKNKVFFFFNYEGTRIRRGLARVGNVPTANERLGDFSAAAAAANKTTYATIVDRVGDCMGVNQPFIYNGVPNVIPPSCIDPLAAKILGMLPAPNAVPASGALNTNNFVRSPKLIDDTNNYVARGDWQATQRNNVYVRYTNVHRFRFVPGVFGGIIDGTGTSAFGRLTMNSMSAAAGLTSTITDRMVNEFRMGWGRNYSVAVQDPFGLNTLAELGFKGVADNPLYSGGIPGLAISGGGGVPNPADGGGLDRLGSPDFLPKSQITNQFQWVDTVSYTRGAHTLRFGADFRGPMRNIFLDVPSLRGTYNFDGNRTGIPLADFLLGYPSSVQLSTLTRVDSRLWMLSGFGQDDWKVTPKLTMNLGLRYDFATWPYEAGGRATNFDPATGQRFTVANSPYGKSLVRSDKNNFAPRVGLAYQLTTNTVVRAGYGRFFMLFERAGSEDQLGLNLPFLVQNQVSAANNNSTASNIRLKNGFNLSLDPNVILADPVKLTGILTRGVNPKAEQPEIDQWNLGIQRMLGHDFVLTADYVGTKGTYLSILHNLNQVCINPDRSICPNVASSYQYPAFGPIEFRDNVGNSSYHGLELTLDKRFSNGLGFRGAYTWSHSIDQAMEHLFSGGSNSFLQNMHNLSEWRGRSDFDIRQRFVFSYTYDLPFGPKRKFVNTGVISHIIGDWRVSGIGTFHSGRPFTIFFGGNNSAVRGRGGLGNALADCNGQPRIIGSVDAWFDPNTPAFSNPQRQSGTPGNPNFVPAKLGTCGRNTVEGPGYKLMDFALAREFNYFGEGRSLLFRWEVFNLTNTPQFGLPARDRNSLSSFGKITSLAADPRVMQFALKFTF